MTRIDTSSNHNTNMVKQAVSEDRPKRQFGKVLSKVADAALNTTAAVAPMVPGGQLVGAAARGLSALKNGSRGASGEQIDKMWEMQEQNQVFNMQYMQLQQQIQADNRNFSTMSNLLKVRHDTAKAAINNMHA